MDVLVFTDPRCLEHRPGPGYPESPQRLEAVLAGLRAAGREVRQAGEHPAAAAGVEAVHGAAYPQRFRRAVERGDSLLDSADNPLSPGTWEAARGAVDAALHAADHAATGQAAFAAIRPPGHHAEREMAMGFCYLANAAVVAEHLRGAHRLARVAIVDVDVHHGNGTQHLFASRGDVFYASIHQYPFYPGTGAASERGVGAGAGATLNVPLPAGCGDEEWNAALAEVVIPALDAWGPDALVVSLGFDAWRGDPLGGMRVSEEAYGEWARLLRDLARRRCEGRLVALLEGGYDVARLGALAAAFASGLR